MWCLLLLYIRIPIQQILHVLLTVDYKFVNDLLNWFLLPWLWHHLMIYVTRGSSQIYQHFHGWVRATLYRETLYRETLYRETLYRETLAFTCNLTFAVSRGKVKMSATQAAAPAVRSWTVSGGVFSGLARALRWADGDTRPAVAAGVDVDVVAAVAIVVA